MHARHHVYVITVRTIEFYLLHRLGDLSKLVTYDGTTEFPMANLYMGRYLFLP